MPRYLGAAMADAHAAFSDYVASKQLKMTPQRMHILDVFLAQQGHVTSEELYAKVKQDYKTIGQATVYRTLKLLTESGLAKEVDFGDGTTRYEPQRGQDHHDHLICERCGLNEEILDETIEKLQEDVAARHGYVLTRHKMYLYGVCPRCRSEKKD